MTVMIVEDSGVMQQVWRDMLASIPALTLIGVYGDAAAAIAGLRRLPPAIVLLDVQLDQSSGIDVLRVLATEQAEAKVIVVTSEPDALYRRHYLNAGAYAFYGKHELNAIHQTLTSLASSKLSDPVGG